MSSLKKLPGLSVHSFWNIIGSKSGSVNILINIMSVKEHVVRAANKKKIILIFPTEGKGPKGGHKKSKWYCCWDQMIKNFPTHKIDLAPNILPDMEIEKGPKLSGKALPLSFLESFIVYLHLYFEKKWLQQY